MSSTAPEGELLWKQVEHLARACCRIHNIDPDRPSPEGGLFVMSHSGSNSVPAWHHFREHALNFVAMSAALQTFAPTGVTEHLTVQPPSSG